MFTLYIPESLIGLPVRHNLAVSRPAMMDSVYTSDSRFIADKATDGRTKGELWETKMPALGCMHTEHTTDAWWRVDLGSSEQVIAVAITNRDNGGAGKYVK